MWCGSHDHSTITYPRRQKAIEKGVVRTVPPPRQGNMPLKLPRARRAHIMSKKKAIVTDTVVTGTFFLNSKSFCVLFDSGATHSFISICAALQLNLKQNTKWANYKISLSNRQVIECLVLYKLVPIVIAEHEVPGDLIQFDMLEFDIILRMDWLTVYGTNIDCKDLKVTKVTLNDAEGREVCFYRERLMDEYSTISIMEASKMLRQGCIGYLCMPLRLKNMR